MPLATVVDWGALLQVLYASFAGALLLTGLFTAGVLLVEPDGAATAPATRRTLGVVALLACLALLALGLSVLFDK